jgi:superfamily II DNA or RNA helicase
MTDSFAVGSQVVVRASGDRGVVLSVEAEDLYHVGLPGGPELLSGQELAAAELTPDARLIEGQHGDPIAYGLRLQALYLRHAYRYDLLSGLSNARIEPALHQVFVAHRVAQKLQPRMILADEVGLGKTIEAGLILKELRARGLAERVLVVTPASLQIQWQQELRSKFNEQFEIIDGAAARYLGRGGANPWTRHNSVICSLPFACHPKRAEQVVDAGWDVVVFDEAHRVRRYRQGRKDTVTQAYRMADELKEIAHGLLLLTATPMQLQTYELYSLIELVEPGLFPTPESYEQRRRELPRLNLAMRALRGWSTLSRAEREVFVEEHQELLDGLGYPAAEALFALNDDGRRETAMDVLAEKHPLAQVLVRNRKAEVGGFKGRTASRHIVELTDTEAELYHDVTEYIRWNYDQALAQKNLAVGFLMVTYQKMVASSSHAIRASLQKRLIKLRKELAEAEAERPPSSRSFTSPSEDEFDPEALPSLIEGLEGAHVADALLAHEIGVLEDLIERLGQMRDSKAAELVAVLQRIFAGRPDEKVLVFTTFIETQLFLRRVLESVGLRVSIFNGSMKLDDKEEAVRVFRTKGQVLISTEAGGEGRNFQFCHLLFNYDLPWNPMRVEQRIGRLDRIGQTHPVQIYNLACAGTVEERVLSVLEFRIRLFEESVGSLDPILGEVEADIERLVMTRLDTVPLLPAQDIEEELQRRVEEARLRERTLADFVLDRASLRRDLVNRLLDQHTLATHQDLQAYCSEALSFAGGALNEHSEGGLVVSLSPRLSRQLQIPSSTVRGCFDPELALRMEDLDFFAFGNKLVEHLIALPIDDSPASACTRVDPTAPAGLWFEAWYELRFDDQSPTGTFLRHLVGPSLEVCSATVTELPSLGQRGEEVSVPTWVRDAVAASKAHYQAEFSAQRASAREGAAGRKIDEVDRSERIFRYREVRLRQMVDTAASWIADKEARGSDRDRRVLPARRGKLAKDRERLAHLRAEFDEQVSAIEGREPSASGRLLAAALVVGER